MTNPFQGQEVLIQRIKASTFKAETMTDGLTKRNQRYLYASIGTSALSTLVAGITAALGPVMGSGVEGWRLACALAAILAFTATVITSLSQQLNFSRRLAEGTECLGRLRSLDTMIATGSRDWQEIAHEYEDIVRKHPIFVA